MLSIKQSKLVKLAEEASEVAKEALKVVHLSGRVHEGETPEQRLHEEVLDVLVCIRTLQQLEVLPPITEGDIEAHFRSKLPKIRKYTEIACDLGNLGDYWIPAPWGSGY